MDWESISANWQYYKSLAQLRWTKLTVQQVDLIAGRREAFVVHLSSLYGISQDAAQMQLESWQGRLRAPAPWP